MTDYPQQSAVGTGIAQAFGEGAGTSFRSEEIAALLQALSGMQAKIDELARQPRQDAHGTGIAQADRGSTATVNNYITGSSPDEVALSLRAAGAAAQAKIDELGGQLRTSSEAVLGFFKILQEENVPLEQLQMKLTLIAQRHVGMLERLAALDPEDADAQGYIDEARQVLGQAASTKDYDQADALLSRAEEAQDSSLRRAEALEREAHEVASRIRRGKAATRAERGELSLTRLDYLQAALHFRTAASLVAGGDQNLKLAYLTRSADALRTYGDEKGDNAILAQAIAVYRDVVRERTQERKPLQWAATQNSLGNALGKLGEREGGTQRLEEAVAAYREALKEYARERMPLEWAGIQNNLGNALQILGEREGGKGRLEEGVTAYREALKEITRERVPLQWAMTQNNLGNVLLSLGERESEIGRLEEAVSAYREALKETTREQAPLEWAMTQNNLGNVLLSLGERESGTQRLEEALTAYREALKERTRERVPLEWAATQDNLGNVLLRLGELVSGTQCLEEGVTAHREALKEFTRERVPLEWAAAQNNLGNVLLRLGERESGTGRLEEARVAFELARDVYRDAGMNQRDLWVETHLRSIDDLIAPRRSGS
jgi:tetratricopeptide (TPR) repeat protein